MSDTLIPDSAAEFSPTEKLVFAALDRADGPLTTAEVIEETKAPPSSVRGAIYELKARGVVESISTTETPNSKQHGLVDRDR